MQVTIKTNQGEILAVKLKFEPYFKPMVINESNSSYLIYKKKSDKGYKTIRHKLPKADWQLIDPLSEVTDKQAKMIGFDNLEHFKRVMQANEVYEVNPYGLELPKSVYFHKGQAVEAEIIFNAFKVKWQSAQERTGNSIILFNPKES
ncbi:MAG: hypothetical protein J7577_00810 [Sphingobacteriaceae bacterium]|nr:hypothetical protein [Sphingobacteriaceae bacterium]